MTWPPHVAVVDCGMGWNFENKRVSYDELLHKYYARTSASLLILKADPIQQSATGCTELIGALAMGRPVIRTRTGALPTQIDVESESCRVFVPPADPKALANGMKQLADDPAGAERMGQRARQLLAETYYKIKCYARHLHEFFEMLWLGDYPASATTFPLASARIAAGHVARGTSRPPAGRWR